MDLNQEQGDKLVEELGETVAFHKTNVCEEEQVQGAIDLAVKKFGGVHGAINSAGCSFAQKNR